MDVAGEEVADGHEYVFRAGANRSLAPLVLLHGSDGHESDLLALAGELAPRAATVGVRGGVVMDGGYSFFRRWPDRRVDEADLTARAAVLAEFLDAVLARHGLSARAVAVGFSNGAVMAAALLLTRPQLLTAAILFRPLPPFHEDLCVRLDSTPVLIIDGALDHRRSPGDGQRLAATLQRAGASVTHHVLPAGHEITAGDRVIAHDWLQSMHRDQTQLEQ